VALFRASGTRHTRAAARNGRSEGDCLEILSKYFDHMEVYCKTKTKTKQAGAPQTVIIVRSREILSKYFDLGEV
jgi:hypothetical protein